MTTSLLIPLRIPELGPSLGKIVVGTGRSPGGLDLTPIRYRLATRLFDAAGEARRLADREDRDAALVAIGRTSWLEAWDEAVNSTTDLVVDLANERIQAEAAQVGLARRRRRKLLVTPRERRTLHARLGSSAAAMVRSLDEIEAWGPEAITGKNGDAMRAWRDAVRKAARRLEAAWLALELTVVVECGRWDAVVREVAGWRKPMWPVVLFGIVGFAAAIWLGLVLGGYIASPDWFTDLWTRITAI